MIMEKINVVINGENKEYDKNISLEKLAHEYQGNYEHRIVLAKVNGKLLELFKKVKTDNSEIEFVTLNTKIGYMTYQRSAIFLMLKAIYDVYGKQKVLDVRVQHSLSKGLYCDFKGELKADEEFIKKVENRMNELVKEDVRIEKRSEATSNAISIFNKHKMYDKERLFRYRRVSKVNIYSIEGFEDYFYGYMVPSTGYIDRFKLYPFGDGFVIQLPTREEPEVIPEFEPQVKLFGILKEAAKWLELMEVENVGALNDAIANGRISELMLVQEALQEKKLAQMADEIASHRDKKFVMIAGPSSSGKTTFSHRLSVQLMTNGLKPHPISLDDYFVERVNTPRDEFGEYNFECLAALDIKQFNEDMCNLLEGKTVEIPTFNFKAGRREYKGNNKTLGPDDILVIEGIHGLNDRLSYSLPRESKYKIYISALTQLNIDEHNRIPTTDGRLIRRIVRDARTRGTSAKQTISMWDSVRRGEEQNIFRFQEGADAMFNSALIYELAVLKQYAEPLLFSIKEDEPEYDEAKRLLKFLDYFLGITSEDIPKNSILREFIGGSCFRV